MNNAQNIYEWFKEHEDNALMLYEVRGESRMRLPITGYKVDFNEPESKLIINRNDNGTITISLSDLDFTTDKRKMDYSDRVNHSFKNKIDADDMNYDIQLVGNDTKMSFVIVE